MIRGISFAIAPATNYYVQEAAEAYQAQLREPKDGTVRFVNFTLEEMIAVIRLCEREHADALFQRYCDFDRLGSVA